MPRPLQNEPPEPVPYELHDQQTNDQTPESLRWLVAEELDWRLERIRVEVDRVLWEAGLETRQLAAHLTRARQLASMLRRSMLEPEEE